MSSDPSTSPEAEVAPEEIPVQPLDVPTEVPVEVPVTGLPPLPKAGVNLARWLLVMIGTFVLLTVVWLVWSEFSHFQWLYSQRSSLQADDVSAIIRERGTFREFWLKISQMVLLNTLLPVLTAVLGYVFGSRSS